MAFPSLRSAPARSPRFALGLLLGINLMNYIDRYVLAAVEPLIAKELFPPGDPHEQTKMGLLVTAFLVSYMISAPVFGWLGDRFNRWSIIAIGVALFSLASGASGLSTHKAQWLGSLGFGAASAYTIMLITRMFVGIGEGAYGPVAPAIISDMFPVQRRGAVLSWFYVAIPVGSALGYVVGGQLGAAFGWRSAFYAVVAPGLLLAFLSLFQPDPRPKRSSTARSADNDLKAALALFRTRSYLLNVAGMTAMTFAIGGVSFWMPRYVAIFRNAGSLDRVNLIFGGITVVAGIAATLAGGWTADRLRTKLRGAYLLVSGIGMLAGFPLFILVMLTPFPYAWGVIFVAILCLFFNTGPSNTAIANVCPPGVRAIGYAVCIFIIHALGDAISPAVIGFVSDRAGGNMNVGFAVVSGAILLASIIWIIASRSLDADTLAAERAAAEPGARTA